MTMIKRAVVYKDMVVCARTQEVLASTKSINAGLIWCLMNGYEAITYY